MQGRVRTRTADSRLHLQIPSPDSISRLSRDSISRFQSRAGAHRSRTRHGRTSAVYSPRPRRSPSSGIRSTLGRRCTCALNPTPRTPLMPMRDETLPCRPMRDETLPCRPMRDETLPCSMLRLHRGDHRRRMQCPDQVSRVPGARHPPRHASAHHDARTHHRYRVPGARHTCVAKSPTPIPPLPNSHP